jgi:uncharacterized SAM-binding protein YcdF (DUF218 family)
MSQLYGEALIVHGGGLTPQEELTEKAVARMDTAVSAWGVGVATNMVVSGGHSFLISEAPALSEAVVMKRYALGEGIPDDAVYTEERSLETVGNALFTKTDIVVPQGWEHLVVVTSESHLPRTLKIFKHIYGSDFEIKGIPAPEKVGSREKLWEALGTALVREILRGTKPGDDEAIKERLFDLIPGYGEATLPRLAMKSLLGLVKKRA